MISEWLLFEGENEITNYYLSDIFKDNIDFFKS